MPWLNIPKLKDIPQPFPPFGEQLRDHRTLRGLTIEEVAQAVSIAPSALREIESGTRGVPSTSLVEALADLLQVTGDQRETFLEVADWESGVVGHLLEKRLGKPSRPPLLASILVFLIADIRGYSRFTEEHGDQAAANLTTRFADIAHGVVERWGGQLLEIRGDEVLSVFTSAQQAVRAGSDLQRCCAEETLVNADLPLAIGIGLDVGEAVAVDGGFRGAAINRAARLCSLAGAGEILVSTGVAYLAPQLDGISFIARGNELLKGFAEPTPILLAAPVDSTLVEGVASERAEPVSS
ncbi:MAG: helix-turn-helix domain-containing protein [Ktedonobacterales bacterium]